MDDLTGEQIREYRGTLTEPGRAVAVPRPLRPTRTWTCSARMRAGEFADGAKTLRAKIDMAAPNINLRDPVMYRIRKATHQRTGDAWCIYPLYDWAHGQSDSHRGRDALDVLAGVRGPPAALRLVPRRARHLPSRSRSSSRA